MNKVYYMAEIRKEKGKVFLELNEKEKKELNTAKNLFELNKVKNVFVLTESESFSGKQTFEKSLNKKFSPAFSEKAETVLFNKKKQESDEKIFELLSEKGKENLSKKVEGEFEKQLNPEEKKRFEELLKEGIIEKFRLNESYKKAIYRINLKKGLNENKEFNVNSPEKKITSNGFEVMVNENQARDFCDQFSAEIKENQIRGIKGFDGYFYAIHSDMLEKVKPEILSELKKSKNVSLKELKEKTDFPEQLLRGTIEFMKEDGDVLEKRKGIYQIIE